MFFPPEHTLLPPSQPHSIFSPQIPAMQLQLCCRAAFHFSGVYFSCPSCCWNLTVLLHCWLNDDVNLEETVPPVANFFKMFSSLIFKNSFCVLQKEVTLKGISCLVPQPALCLTVRECQMDELVAHSVLPFG